MRLLRTAHHKRLVIVVPLRVLPPLPLPPLTPALLCVEEEQLSSLLESEEALVFAHLLLLREQWTGYASRRQVGVLLLHNWF